MKSPLLHARAKIVNREQPKIKAVAGAPRLLQSNGYVGMVDPLMKMGNLTRQDYDGRTIRTSS